MSKRKAAAAEKSEQNPTEEEAGVVNGPKSAEALVLEVKIAEQGGLVRELKARTPKTKELEEETAAAVAELKRLKAELAALSK